jgi:phage gp29-like protein
MTAQKSVELFTEILASDKLTSGYQYFGQDHWATALADNPSAAWQQLRYNPWFAMAIYADMEEKDAAVFSALDTRKNNVLSKTRNIIPASEKRQDKKIAAFIEESLERYFVGFENFLYEALDAVGKGVAIGEIIFAAGHDRIYIEQVKFKPQHLFSFGDTALAGFSTASMVYPQTGPLQLRAGVTLDSFAGQELPEDKFFVFSFRPKYNNRWGDPVDRKAFWPSWIKRSSIKQWLRYQEKGTGVVIAKYPSSAGPKEQDDALGAADAVHNETAVAIPDKFEMEVHEMVRQMGSTHKELVDDFCNAEIFRVFLGQTLTSKGSDGGGSRALGEVHERKEDAIAETDCKALMQAVQQEIIKPLVFLNFGPDAACPEWIIEYEPKEDLDSKAKRYGVIRKEIGLELSKTQVRDDLQLEEPKGDDDALAPAEMQPEPDPLDDPIINDPEKAEFAEKKTLNSGRPSNSRTVRFKRYRPSMIEFSAD